MSQPSRACVIFNRLCGVNALEVTVRLDKGEHRQKALASKCELKKLPLYEDGDFVLPESGAILSYLAARHCGSSHWYPSDLVAKAKVDSALLWLQGNVRAGCTRWVWNAAIAPARGLPYDPSIALEGKGITENSLTLLETYWLRTTPYLAGADVSIADLLCCCELEQLVLLEAATPSATLTEILSRYPKVSAWMRRVSEQCSPHYDEAHSKLRHAAHVWSTRARL